MNRRKFIKTASYSSASLVACNSLAPIQSSKSNFELSPDNPLAINMWDFAWLFRHYKGGGMEDWDKALDELVERGYNALRIDCFPQFVAKDNNGETKESYYSPKKGWRPALWDNQYSITVTPRKSLIEFLTKCQERDIYIGLSSWFLDHATGITRAFKTVEDVARAWDETLQFIQENNLMKNVVYVDLLNEFPLWNGYSYMWLNKKLDKYKSDNIGNVSGAKYDFLNEKGKRFNDQQIGIYNDFINQLIGILSPKWPELKFFASQTNTLNVPWQDLDVSQFSVLDIHCWFVYNKEFSSYTNYFQDIHILRNDLNFKKSATKINEYWSQNKKSLIGWMEDQIIERKTKANELKVPYGNTEGWGTVMWMDHPDLDWSFTKQTGIACAELGRKHGYAFNCSSNFNHPHFGLWDEVAWHQEVTKIIKNV